MLWLAVSALGYFFNSVAVVVDKFLLKKALPHPVVYAFYSSSLGLAVLLLLPFAPAPPSFALLLISVGAGGLFTGALFIFYSVLQRSEVSRIAPIVGGLTPVFILVIAWGLLGETLVRSQGLAFFLIVLGSWLVGRNNHGSHHTRRGENTGAHFETLSEPEEGFEMGSILPLSVLAAFMFAASYVLSKLVYVHYDFVGGLIWRTIGAALAAAAFILIREDRQLIKMTFREQKNGTSFLFLVGQSCGALSFVLANYAFSIGSVALVNALSGLQYLFVFAFTTVLTRVAPNVIQETVTPRALFQKLMSLILIGSGIVLLFL